MLINNQYKFQFEPYRRQFKIPLRTSHGIWQIREGIIITLKDTEGNIGQGEIAPLAWFGSETLEEAQQFCQQLGNKITKEVIFNISDRLTACQFAFESAFNNLSHKPLAVLKQKVNSAYLLATGKEVLTQDYHLKSNLVSSTFKWKIGLTDVNTELTWLKQLIAKLSPNARLRLDANGGLTLKDAHQWLEFAQNQPIIEFIEQPLPPSQLAEMMILQQIYSTTLALDESVANLSQLKYCYDRGWRGIFIIKAAIAGYPSHLRQFCHANQLDLVFSSVFETKIGLQAALALALELGNRDRAMGFGVGHWFSDGKART